MSPGLMSVISATSDESILRVRGAMERYRFRSGLSSGIASPSGRNCTMRALPISMNLSYSAENTNQIAPNHTDESQTFFEHRTRKFNLITHQGAELRSGDAGCNGIIRDAEALH